MTETIGFFDQAEVSAGRIMHDIELDNVITQADATLVVRAFRESVALMRGMRSENESLKARLRPSASDEGSLTSASDDALLEEIRRRMKEQGT